MLTEVAVSRYVVKVRGITICAPQPSYSLAEGVVAMLPPDQQPFAEIVIVTEDNKQLLLG